LSKQTEQIVIVLVIALIAYTFLKGTANAVATPAPASASAGNSVSSIFQGLTDSGTIDEALGAFD
jgi:hypothetical protein